MNLWRGLGSKIISLIEERRLHKQLEAPGADGDFYRKGGKRQLYENLPISERDWVWDAGGYHGEWTATILTRYGCCSELFEPVPEFFAECNRVFAKNSRVKLHFSGLGDANRTTQLRLNGSGTSEFSKKGGKMFSAKILNINEEIKKRISKKTFPDAPAVIGCLKLNIEGGEYSVLNKLIETGEIKRFRCMLIQFHRQPPSYQSLYANIIQRLSQTHHRVWSYPMIWERWDSLLIKSHFNQ